MYRKMAAASALLLPIFAFWIYHLVHIRPADRIEFKKRKEQHPLAASPISSDHLRRGVNKEIWFAQDNCSRLHYKICSDHSRLSLTPFENKFEVVERLDGITCWMQDKLTFESDNLSPSQQSRYFEADTGTYRYSTQEFTAEGVALSLFRLPGHDLPKAAVSEEKAFMHGIAADISFFFGGKTPQFQANQFQAKVVRE